jgi:hypothetical protein
VSRRLAAAVAGAAVILLLCATYSLEVQPRIAGSNGVAPLFAAVKVSPGTEHCQHIPHLPAKLNRIRVFPTGVRPPGALRVTLSDASGIFAEGVNRDVVNGTIPIRLDRLTRRAHPGEICLTDIGSGQIVLAGEEKRVGTQGGVTATRKRVASVVYLRAGSSKWAGRAGAISDRFGGANQGAFGGWSLWAAAALLFSASGLAFWWLILRLEPNAE